MIASILAYALLAVPALAHNGISHNEYRMRRPRGERPADAARERDARGDRPADPLRMRDDGMPGTYGMYGEMDMGLDMDMGMGCSPTVFEVGSAKPELSTLGVAIQAAGQTESVMDPFAELTLLAPNNDAFAAIDEETLTALLNAPELLSPILLLHAIEGGVLSTDLTDGMVVPTLAGEELVVGVSDAGVTFTSPAGVVANVVEADIVVCKSVIHVIDAVLLP